MLKLPAKAASTAKADPSLSLPPPPSVVVVVVVRPSQTSEQVSPLPPLWSHIHGDRRKERISPRLSFWHGQKMTPGHGRRTGGQQCGDGRVGQPPLLRPASSHLKPPPPRLALATVRRHQPETLHFPPSSVFYYLSAAAAAAEVWPTGSRPSSSSFLSPIFYSAYSADTSHRDSEEQCTRGPKTMRRAVPLSFTVKSVSGSHQSQLLFRLILSIRNFAHVPSMATPPLPGGGTTIKNLPLSPPPPHGLTRVCMCVCAWNSLRRPPRGRVGRGRRRIEKRRVPSPPSFLAVPRRLPLHATSRRHRPQPN